MVIVFVLVAVAVLAVVAGLHWYVWRRLVRDTTAGPGTPRRVGTAVFAAGPVLMVAALVAERAGAPFWLQRALGWPGFLWMALALYLLLAVLAGEVVRPLLRRLPARRTRPVPTAPVPALAGAPATAPRPGSAVATPTDLEAPHASGPPRDPTPLPPSRRLFVSRVVGGAAATAAVATVGHGTYGVLRGPRVQRVAVPLARLPRAADGYRIAVVSDIHLGPVLGRGFAQTVVDTINAARPDLIAVVGDLVDGSVKDLGPAAAPLAQLSARHGAYFVTGHHEYFSGAALGVPPGP